MFIYFIFSMIAYKCVHLNDVLKMKTCAMIQRNNKTINASSTIIFQNFTNNI